MLDLHKIRALLHARQIQEQHDYGDPFVVPIEKYAREVLGMDPLPEFQEPGRERREHWFTELAEKVRIGLAELADTVAENQRAAGARLATLPEEGQFWGVARSNRWTDSAVVGGS